MKKLILTATLAVLASPALASAPTNGVAVPEMDAGAGIAAIALLAGVAAIVREKMKRK